jgi:chromosome segregation ATPase
LCLINFSFISAIQAIPTDDERTQAFDTLSTEHNALKIKLTNIQEENVLFRDKLKSADEDRLALENVIENFRQNALREKETTKKLYVDLLAAREQDSVEISRLKQIENLYNQTLADNADLRQLLEKEHQLLELTRKLTEKNSILQSDYEQLQILYQQTVQDLENLKQANEEYKNELLKFEISEKSVKIQLKELEEKYQILNKLHDQIVKQYDDCLIEIQTLKKKHQANTKDLIKQLQQLQKPKPTTNGDSQSPILLTR